MQFARELGENLMIIYFGNNYTDYAEMNYSNSGPVKMKTMTQRWKTCNEQINSRGSRASVLFASIHEPSVLSQKHLSIVWKCTELRFMLGVFVSRRHFLRNIAAMIREFLKTIEWEMRGIGFFLPFSTASPPEQIKARQKYISVIWLLHVTRLPR